jgi:putative membrane protein
MVVTCAAVSLAGGHAAAQSNAAVLGRMAAADQGEIMQAQYAAQNATRDDVREYANMLVSDHTGHLQAVRDTASALAVTPDSTAARDLMAAAQRQMAQLQGLSGPALDRQFLVFMVQDHGGLQRELDGLIRQGQPAQLLPFIRATRAVVHRHLVDAQNLQRGGQHSMSVHKDNGR